MTVDDSKRTLAWLEADGSICRIFDDDEPADRDMVGTLAALKMDAAEETEESKAGAMTPVYYGKEDYTKIQRSSSGNNKDG